VQATRLSKSFGSQTLFEDLSFRLDPGQVMALVGPNGAGKTTLLRILSGEIPSDGGEVGLPRGARLALHDQRPPLGRDISLGAYVGEGLGDVRQVEKDLAALEESMAGGDGSEETLAAYQRAQDALERAGGYEWRAWRDRVLRGLGMDADVLERPLQSFSGGELTRASLARALLSRPDVLLLDEPTNHLDMEAMDWLERSMSEMAGSVVVVSHDRWFLESVATSVLEIEMGRAKLWPMKYSAYRRERALAIGRQGQAAERQGAEIARLERFVAKWSAGTKARQAQSRKKQLEKIQPVAVPVRRRSLEFGFPKAEKPGRVVIEVDGLNVVAGDKPLVADAGFVIERSWRVAVVGPNGAGKTTLLETLLGKRPAARGRVTLGHKVEPGYFSQHAAELPEGPTVLETVLSGASLTTTQARTLLGRFLFSGDEAEKRIEKLSGGERRRVSLVRMIARGGNLLVLDEPTNHLDIESREALEDALEAYDGTVLMVSHDRALIDTMATHTLSIEHGTAVLRNGCYSDLVALREAAANASAPAAKKSAPAPKAPAEPAAPRKNGREVAKVEKKIEAVEANIAAVEAAMSDPAIATDHEALAEHSQRHQDLQEELAWLMREWEDRVAAEA
jgi:ATP-binding cassette subfamily F protein 3